MSHPREPLEQPSPLELTWWLWREPKDSWSWVSFFKSLTPEFQCKLFLLFPGPGLNLAVKTVFPLGAENIILPAQGSSDTSSLKTIQDLVLPFICVCLGTRYGVGRLSCHPVMGEGTSVLQSVLSPCWHSFPWKFSCQCPCFCFGLWP